jgi:putative transposase
MAVEKFGASERLACKILGQNRSAFRKKKPDMGFEEARLRTELRALAGKHPSWGWRKARWHLAGTAGMGGHSAGPEAVRRLWREEGLVASPGRGRSAAPGPAPGNSNG